MKKIFVSYRRQDSAIFTGRLYDRLIDYYGSDTVFLDIDSIPGAADFPVVLRESIQKCGVFLAIIGRQWTGPDEGDPSNRRIDDPDDFVRLELEQALLNSKPVIPVYFDQCQPLAAAQLPDSLKSIATANAIEVDVGKDFDHHMLRLRNEVNRYIIPSPVRLMQHTASRLVRQNRVGLCLLVVATFFVLLFRDPIGRMLMPLSGLHAVVSEADSDVFSSGADGKYQLVRGLANRETLVDQTDIVASIRDTRETFDIFAQTASVMVGNYEAVSYALNQGARIRIVIFDHGDENEQHLRSFYEYCGTNSNGAEWGKRNADQVAGFIQKQSKRHNGNIEIRRWQGPFHNSLWVRDSKIPDNAMGHIEVTFYGDLADNPSLRFGRLSPDMLDGLQRQFDYIWSKSVEVPTVAMEPVEAN